MKRLQTRRDWLVGAGAALSGTCIAPVAALSAMPAPAAPVAIGRCRSYEHSELLPALELLFDRIGGLGRLVRGKTVAIKINLTGRPGYRCGYLPLGDTHYTNPEVIAATVHLMGRAGARRIRLIESPWSSADPVEEYLLQAGWEPLDILRAADRVEFVNTNFLGKAKAYSRLAVPGRALMFPGFDVHAACLECDLFVSLTKLKEHATTGVTLSMKNCFGILPATIYGDGAGKDAPSVEPRGGRTMIHSGSRQPSGSAPPEIDRASPRDGGYRVPRTVVDIVASRPVHLSIIEAVRTIAGGEGPWIRGPLPPVSPGLLLAGTNPVSTDAVGMATMGYDPMSDRGSAPFRTCDNILRLAEDAGIGTRDLRRIDIRGLPLRDAVFDFKAL
jgi:uncharacterized protein (DUF362 family)